MAIIDPWQEEQRVQNAIIDPWQEEKEQPQLSKNKGFAEEFAQGVPRGWHQTKSALYAAGAMASSALGLDETRDSFLKKATEAEAKAQEYPAGTQSFTNIESIYDVPGYIGGLLGEQVTNMGETAITTLAGSLIGSAMGPGGTAAGAAGGILAKATIRNMMTSIAKGLTKQGVEKNLAKSMAEEALTRMPMKNIYRSIGAKAGMVAGTFPLEAGGNYLESYQKGYDNPWSAAATGGAAALLELAGGGSNVIDAIFNPKTMGSGLKLVGQVFGWLGKTAAQEGGQEAGQEFLSVLNEKINDPKGVTIFDKQNLARMLDAAVAGAAVGTIYGGAGAGISATTTNKAQQEAKATDTVRWYLQNTRERFLDEKDPYGTTEMSADLDNLVKASGGFFTEAMKAEEIARMGKQRPIRTKEDAIRTVEDVKQDTTIPPESKNQRIIDLMSLALDLPERGNIPEAITPEAQGRADSIQEAYAELERIRRDVAKEGPTPEDLLLGSREKVEKALKKESPAKTAYDYGKSAFDRGIKSVPSLDAEFMKTLEGREVGASTKDLKEWSRGWQEANLAAPIPEKGEKKQGAQEIVREEVEAVAATPKGKKGKKQAAIAPEPAQEEVRRTIEEAQKKLQGQKEALQQGVTVPPGIDNFDSYLIASGIDPIELGKKLKEEKAIGQSATDKEGSATFQAVKLTREWEAYVNNGHKAPESTKEVTEHGEEMQGQTEEPEGQEVAPPGEVTPGAEVLKGYPELTTTGKTTEEAPKKEPKTKEAKPKSLLRIVQEHGGLDRKATQAGYQDTEGLKSISFAFTNKREKGSGIMDPGDLATELQGLGLLGPTPDTVSGPGEWLIQQLLDERRRKRDNITEDKQDELERAAEQQVIEDLRADGRSESEIAEILGTVQEDIAAPISDEELSARAAADREIESLKSELIVSEEEDEEEQPSAPPPQDQQKAERDRIARDVEGKLFDDSGAFSLSGQQPVVQKTMQTQEKKGERILDVKKADTNELYERLKGKKQGDIGQSYGVISPEWDSLDIDDTIRSYWKTKLEAEYGRTNEENRGPGIADDPRKIRDHGLSFPSGEELGRLLDRQIAKTRGRADSKWFESVVLDLGIRNTPEFRLAERHFASFGYTLIPIGEVAWGGAVNHADKVAYLSNVTGDAFAYFMSHETSHILSNQGNKAVLAIKDNIDTGHPVFVDVSGNLGMGDNFALEELTAAIVGGMDSYLAILQGPKEVSDKNVKSARRASLEGDGDKTPLFRKAPVFYSQLLRTVEAKINDMPAKAQSIVGWLIKNQVKPMEIEEIGLEGWLKENRRPNIVKVEPSKDGVIGDKIFTFSDGARLEARDEDHAVEEYRYDRGKEPPLSDRIDKQALLDFIRANQIEFKEVEKGDRKGFDTWLADKGYGTDNISLNSMTAAEYERLRDQYFQEQERDGGNTKFSSYILPGGTNYREVLVTMPEDKRLAELDNALQEGRNRAEDRRERISREAGTFRSSHWSEPNVIGHLRMQDFTDTEGKKVLLVEEVQSDWHQEGKKKGYKRDETSPIKVVFDRGEWHVTDIDGHFIDSYPGNEMGRQDAERAATSMQGGVPNAPLKENWQEMLMKRALRFAAEEGYDKIAWTTGETQAERYDLSKQVDSIDVMHNGYPGAEGTYDITAEKDGHVVVTQQRVSKNSLPDLIGKDLAKKAISETEQPGTSATYSGLDLKIGGKGMAVFYDQKIPAFMQKYVKPWGGKVGGTDISFEDRIPNKPGEPYGWNDMVRHYTVHSISITPAMRDAVMQGQPLYRTITTDTLPDTIKAPATPRFSVSQVNVFLKGLVAKLPNIGTINVVKNYMAVPVDIAERGGIVEMAQNGEELFGLYDPKTDTTYIFADSIASEKDARSILIHEVVGHRGVRAILHMTERKVLEKSVLEAYKGSTILNQVVGNYDLDLTKESDRETALDELVAHIAEARDVPTLWSKIVRLFKLALARLGLGSYKESDVDRLIRGAFRYAEGKGTPFAGGMTRAESFRKVPLSPDNIARAIQWHLDRAQQDFDAAREMRNRFYRPRKAGDYRDNTRIVHEYGKKDAEQSYEKAKERLDIVRQLSDALDEYGPEKVYDQVHEALPGWRTNLEETINYLANGKKKEIFFRKIMPSKQGPGKSTKTSPEVKPEGGEKRLWTLGDALKVAETQKADIAGKFYLRFDPVDYKEGDVLPKSRRWKRDEVTDKVLSGTSVIDPDYPFRLNAWEAMNNYGEGYLYVVKGKKQRKGHDTGEVIVTNPVVIRKITLSDLPNPSRPPGEGGQTPLLRKALPFKDRFHEEVDDISAILKAKTNQPLSFAERMLRSPEWFGHQVFKDLVKIFTRTRKELYHNYFNAFVGSGDEDAVKALADLKNKGMSLSDRMKGHTSKEYQLLEQMTDEADRNNVKTRQAEEVWRSRNYPEEVVDVWRTVRESYDRQLDALIQPLKEYLEEIALDSFALDKETPARGWYYVAPKEDFDRFITLTPDKAEGRGFVSEPGVNYILGAKGESGGKYTVQAISFDMNVFTKERAARWFADHITDFKMSPINTNYELMNTLQGALTSMNKWRGSYAPRIRPDGEWAVVGTRGEGDEKERFRTHGSHRQMLKLSRDMEKDGWVVRVEHVNKLPESVYQDIKTAAVANAIDNAVQGLQGTDTFRAQILQNAADMIRARGFRSAMIHRKTGQAVSGYITDPMERLLRYTNNNAGGMSKAEVSRQATEVLLGKYIPTERDEEGKVITRAHREGGVDPAKDPQLYDAATDYIREQLRNVEHSDKVIGLAKSIATFKYLGFNPRSLVVNMTALATTVPPSIVQYGTDGKASFAEVLRELPKAMKDYVSFMAGKPLSDAKDQAFLDAIKKAGDTDAQMVRDATGQLHGVIHKGAQKAMDIAMIGFSKSEELNRGATMLAAYRLAQKHGFSEEQAQEKAKDASDKAHGVYGKGTLPLWAIGNNPAAKIGQMLYVYSKFGHNYVQMLYDLGFTNTNIKAFVWALAAPVVLAGGAATPFKDELLALLQAILRALGYTGNLERDMWASVRNHLGKGAEKVARYGIAGQLGVDITGSLSVGVGIPKGLWDLTGAPGAVWEDIATAYRFASRGKVGRAIEKGALPTGLANVPRAFREKAEGITTEQGRRVWDERGRPYVPSATETGLRVAGFGSSDESVVKARTWESKKAELSFKDRRDAIYEELRAYYSNPNRKTSDYQDIMKKVVKYNKAVRESGMGRAEVPPITTESIRRQRAGVSRPQKKDIERLRDMPL